MTCQKNIKRRLRKKLHLMINRCETQAHWESALQRLIEVHEREQALSAPVFAHFKDDCPHTRLVLMLELATGMTVETVMQPTAVHAQQAHAA